jgi:hypothetical protein
MADEKKTETEKKADAANTETEKKADTTTPAPTGKPDVLAVLGSTSPVGKLMVGNTALTAIEPALISAEDFERLEAEYGLEEVKAKKDK